MQENQVFNTWEGWEDPLEEEMATRSSIPDWNLPRTEEPGRLQSLGLQRAGHSWATKHETQRPDNRRVDLEIWRVSPTWMLIENDDSWSRASLVAQRIKNPPAMQETWVQSLSWEDPLEEGMATPVFILAWRILWTEEPGGLQSMGSQRVRHDWATKHAHGFCPRPIESASAFNKLLRKPGCTQSFEKHYPRPFQCTPAQALALRFWGRSAVTSWILCLKSAPRWICCALSLRTGSEMFKGFRETQCGILASLLISQRHWAA